MVLSVALLAAQQVALYGPTGPAQPGWFPGADKIQHALGFALPLTVILLTLWVHAGRDRWTLPAALAVGLLAVNAVVSELVQGRPGSGRTGDPLDTIADLVGIGLGWLAFWALRERVLAGGGR